MELEKDLLGVLGFKLLEREYLGSDRRSVKIFFSVLVIN